MKYSEVKHDDESQTSKFKCEKCEIGFSNKRNFDRHNRENHFESNVNVDYVENLEDLNITKCENCDKTFKRKSDLKRHSASVHRVIDTKKEFICSVCGKEFSRKDAMNRHIKSLHKE